MVDDYVVLDTSRIKIEDLANEICANGGDFCSVESMVILKAKVDKVSPDGYIDLVEAFEYVYANKFSPENISSKTEKRLFSTIHKKFFKNASFYHEKDGKKLVLPMQIEECEDGDTCSYKFIIGDEPSGLWMIKFRFAGIDTPESIKGWSYCGADPAEIEQAAQWRACEYKGVKGERVRFKSNYCVTDPKELEEARKKRTCLHGTEKGEWLYKKNPKLINVEDHTIKMWEQEKGLSNHWPIRPTDKDGRPLTDEARKKIAASYEWMTKKMVQEREVFAGDIAGVAMKDIDRWLREEKHSHLYGEVTYNRASGEAFECDSMNLVDKYGRFVARIVVAENMGQDLIGDFIENELWKAMGPGKMVKKLDKKTGKLKDVAQPGGADYHVYFTQDTEPKKGKTTSLVRQIRGYKWVTPMALQYKGKKLLEGWGDKTHPMHEAWQMLSPETLPNPQEIFSKERCKLMAETWRNFIKDHPDYKDDVQLMLVLLGLGYAYPKYRNEHLPVYAEAEQIAIKNGFGFWQGRTVGDEMLAGEPIFLLMRPDPNDPKTLAYRFKDDTTFTGADSEGEPKRLDPPDCCEVPGSD